VSPAARSKPTARLLAGLLPDRALTWEEHLAAHGPLAQPGPGKHLVVEVERSGLLGRGGAGFPTGRKMRTVAAGARRTVVVANGAESEPASHKDHVLLSHEPHLVLDGMELAAGAIAADQGHLLVHRGSSALPALRVALAERARARVDRTPVTLHELPARYVASEESALVHFLNGGDAKPTYTPPRPFEQGVARRPTLVNNVETLAQVALIARHGSEWFRAVGDADEPGTLLVTVSGPGTVDKVVEVPTGTSLEQTTRVAGVDLGAASAVLVGGYFGTWVGIGQARALHLTQHALRAGGGALGAGVLLAVPHGVCGVTELARVARYLARESAGQCGPCLNGLPAIAAALEELAGGSWDPRRGAALDRWLSLMPGRGACRHPDGATRFVGTGLAAFAEDVERHQRGMICAPGARTGWLPVPATAEGVWR
jgi:NADH:ubiquinone oxidoreductase subunit F (NADH-binding)